jgi:hypothetical protein
MPPHCGWPLLIMIESSNKTQPLVVDTAIVILMMTAAAYLAAFFYDYEYLSYFGLPAVFAEVSLRGLLLSALTGVAVLSLGAMLTHLAVFMPEKISRIVLAGVLGYAAIFLFISTMLALIGASWKDWPWALTGPSG